VFGKGATLRACQALPLDAWSSNPPGEKTKTAAASDGRPAVNETGSDVDHTPPSRPSVRAFAEHPLPARFCTTIAQR
jgi:hypothetical protein